MRGSVRDVLFSDNTSQRGACHPQLPHFFSNTIDDKLIDILPYTDTHPPGYMV